MACKHIISFFYECGHRSNQIEHISGCPTGNVFYLEIPDDIENFIPIESTIYRKPNQEDRARDPPGIGCKTPELSSRIFYTNCEKCWATATVPGLGVSDPLPKNIINLRRTLFDKFQGDRSAEGVAKRVARRKAQFDADLQAFQTLHGETCIQVFDDYSDDDVFYYQQELFADPVLLADFPDERCGVCQELLSEESAYASGMLDPERRQLPCDHLFHSECLGPWLNDKHDCPLCRRVFWWYRCDEPSFDDPELETRVVAPTWASQSSGHVPFTDPRIPKIPAINNLDDAARLFGPTNRVLTPAAGPPLDAIDKYILQFFPGTTAKNHILPQYRRRRSRAPNPAGVQRL